MKILNFYPLVGVCFALNDEAKFMWSWAKVSGSLVGLRTLLVSFLYPKHPKNHYLLFVRGEQKRKREKFNYSLQYTKSACYIEVKFRHELIDQLAHLPFIWFRISQT